MQKIYFPEMPGIANFIGMRHSLSLVCILPLLLYTAMAQPPIKHAVFVDTAAAKAPYFLLKGYDGKTINITTQKGKVIFINFWALSCIPCKAEMPTINRLQEHFGNDTDILILPVDLDNDKINTPAYMQRSGFSLSVYSAASPVPEQLFKGVLPTTIVIDDRGRIAFYHEGQEDYSTKKFIDYINSLRKR